MKIFQWNISKLNHIKFSYSIPKADAVFIHIGDIIDVRCKSEPQFELKFETSFMVPTKKWFQFASFFRLSGLINFLDLCKPKEYMGVGTSHSWYETDLK